MIKQSIIIWPSIIPLAIVNGALRDLILAPLIGENIALPLSGITLCILIFIMCLIFFPRIKPSTQKDYILTGILWVVLVVCFEFALGYFGMNKSFAELIKTYDITTGNLWLVVVIFVGIVPWLTAKIKHLFISK